MKNEQEIKSYTDAIEAIKVALKSPEIKVDKNHIFLFPWQKGQKGLASRLEKINRVQKKQRSLLDEAKHLLLDLLSLEEAKDVIYGLDPIYSSDRTAALISNITTGQEKRKITLKKKAYQKLKKIKSAFFRTDKGIIKTPEGEYALATKASISPTELADFTEHTTDAMAFHREDLIRRRNSQRYELTHGEKLQRKEDLEMKSMALEVIETIDNIIDYDKEAGEKGISFEERRIILTAAERNKALALREDLRKYLEKMEELKQLENDIEALQYNINFIKERMSDFGYRSAGFNLLDNLYNEYKHELETAEVKRNAILQERNRFDSGSLFTRIEDFLRYMGSSRRFQFKVKRENAQEHVSEKDLGPEMPLDEKRQIVYGAIKETSKTRTIYELYLREIAGKGPNRESFRDFAARHNVEPGFFEYENSLIEESQRTMRK